MTMTDGFEVHPTLLADCHMLGELDLCIVLLNRNASVPWFILVPRTDRVDFLDLTAPARQLALDESCVISQYLKQDRGIEKVNFASIGNVVAQMHLHIVGRHRADSCWPAPVWGNLSSHLEYDADQLNEITLTLTEHYGLRRCEGSTK